MKELIILGGTGSIGLQTFDLVRKYRDLYRVIGFSFGTNLERAKDLIAEFKPEFVVSKMESAAKIIQGENKNLRVEFGTEGLNNLATYLPENKNILLVSAVVGSVGLRPTCEALKIGRNIALANKETLVTAGDLVMKLARDNQAEIYPIDSEHSAIYQCLRGEKHPEIKRLIITASGGSFRDLELKDLENVTKEQALNHPNWKMGAKITIDSSTMMNKGFEVIEAHHLFNIPYENIDTILHRESIVHSLVEFKDSSIKAQLGVSDMRIPILYALNDGKRVNYDNGLNLIGKKLTFEELSFERFPCLKMAYEAARRGNIYPTILNASNEAAVKLFLDGKIKYLDIQKIVYDELNSYEQVESLDIDTILEYDRRVKEKVLKKYGGF